MPNGPHIFHPRVGVLVTEFNALCAKLPIPEDDAQSEGAYRLLALLGLASAIIVDSAPTLEAARGLAEDVQAQFRVACNTLIGTKFRGSAEAVANAIIGVKSAMREDGILKDDD